MLELERLTKYGNHLLSEAMREAVGEGQWGRRLGIIFANLPATGYGWVFLFRLIGSAAKRCLRYETG